MAKAKQQDLELLKKKKLTFSEKVRFTWRQVVDNRINYFMMAPFLLFFFLFTVLPVLSSMVLSFTRYDILNNPVFIGWDNYLRMFLEDDVFMIALKNTLQFAIITGPVSYLLCFVFAWFINDLPSVARAFFTVVFYAPTLANIYFIFQYLFSSDMYGLINSVLMNLGILDEPIAWLTNTKYMLTIVIIVQLWCSLGTGFLSFVAGLQNLDPSLAEAGAIDGVRNRFQELFYITLPQMGGMLMFGAVMQISSAFAVGGISSALLGNPSVDYAGHTLVLHIADFGHTRFELGYASAIAVFLFALMLVTKAVINKILDRFSDD
ncbi:MAG: sugar ABC transporter permease [Clostridia bacterium]|nr:sugar ABC transporter permease [Clostridia bacterium]